MDGDIKKVSWVSFKNWKFKCDKYKLVVTRILHNKRGSRIGTCHL